MVYSFPSSIIDSSSLKEKSISLKENERLSLEGVPHHEVQAFLEVVDSRSVASSLDTTPFFIILVAL